MGGCLPYFQDAPHATSPLPAASLGSWSSPKFPDAPTHAGCSDDGAPRSPVGHPPRAPTRECRGPANSAACATRSSTDPPEARPAPPSCLPRGPPTPTHLAEVAAAAPGLGVRSGLPGAQASGGAARAGGAQQARPPAGAQSSRRRLLGRRPRIPGPQLGAHRGAQGAGARLGRGAGRRGTPVRPGLPAAPLPGGGGGSGGGGGGGGSGGRGRRGRSGSPGGGGSSSPLPAPRPHRRFGPAPSGALKGPRRLRGSCAHPVARARACCHTDTHTLGRDAEFLFSRSLKEEGGGKHLPILPPPPQPLILHWNRSSAIKL